MSSQYARPHLLIVSDDRDLALFLGEGLVMAGFWTSVVSSGLQALEVYRLRTFDIAIVDAALKDFPAPDLIFRFRAPGEKGQRTDRPIVVIAGSTAELEEESALQAGFDAIYYPPIELADLAVRLRTIVEAWRMANPKARWADEEALQPAKD